jgi:DNA-binding LacI/PurR family transcriptional regulator
MNDNPRHTEISDELRREIASGKYGQDGRLPSEALLVRRFGVSRPTVARALRTLETEGLIVRRAGSGTFVKLTPEGREAVGNRSLGLLIPDLGNTEIFQIICGELAGLSRVHNYSLVWGGSTQPRLDADASIQHAKQLCDQYIERRVSGVFLVPFELLPEHEEANQECAMRLRDAGIQVVLLDRDLVEFPVRSDFDVVGLDNLLAGYQIASHFIKLGCTRLHFLTRPLSAPTVAARINGAREALVSAGLPVPDSFVTHGDPTDTTLVRRLLARQKPDAILCPNDHTAAQLLKTLHQMKVKVPKEVRVAGVDDVKFATLISPALTTIAQPCREIAVTAFRTMLERLAEPTLPPRNISVAGRLVIRDSCGAYQKG